MLRKRHLLLSLVFMLSAPMSMASEMEDGFVSLFDGSTLNGWIAENSTTENFVVEKGTLHCNGKMGPPSWLRSEKQYENFDLRFDFLIKGWCNGGLYFHAPLHGRLSSTGFQFQIYHDRNHPPSSILTGSIFEVVPPLENVINPAKQWNTARILMNWPTLKIWVNDTLVQDLNVEKHDELKYRFRKGYFGIQDAGYQTWFRNIRIKELPSTDQEWISLFNGENFDGWYIEGKGAKWSVRDGVIHAEDNGSYLVSDDVFEDFELQCYFRTDRNANGGIFFRWNTLSGGDRGNEIQLENVPDSPHPTGSLYNIVRAKQPRYRDEEWMPLQIRIQGKHCVVRANGETTVDYDGLRIVRPGHISLQMHRTGNWVEWKDLKIKRLK